MMTLPPRISLGLAGLFVCAAMTPLPLRAQGQAPAAPTQFEVASVRLVPPGSAGLTSISPPGSPTFTATKVTLQLLIGLAYGVDSERVKGGPSWLESQQYDVTAKPEGGGSLDQERLKPLLQKLLEQRFNLSVHREKKDMQGYALVVAKGEPKLDATKGDAPHAYILKGRLLLQNMPVSMLASMLSGPAGRPVIDSTGIKGNYDIKINYAPEGATNSELPSIFTALQELGFKLVSQKVPADILAVDRVDRIPVEN